MPSKTNGDHAPRPITPAPRRFVHSPLPKLKRVYLSLGSNLGDSFTLIRKALEILPSEGVDIIRVSSIYKTEPVEFRSQPWFLNCAAEAETKLSPLKLLRVLRSVELAMGRQRGKKKGPRLIDIDILLYENGVVRSSGLVIPHARMHERRFVLVPLRELAPTLRHPIIGKTIKEMLSESEDESKVFRLRDKR